MPTIPLPNLGIDQLTDETQFRAGTVRSAVNVDIDKAGVFKRRDGYTVMQADSDYGAVFTYGSTLLVQKGSQLCAFDPVTYTPTVLADMGSSAPVDSTIYNGQLYICGPRAIWRLPAERAPAQTVGVKLPDALPLAAPANAGTLSPGDYSVAVSVVDSFGEESPAQLLGSITLQSGLQLVDLAVMPGHKWRVYLSPVNGDVLYLAEEFDAVFSQYAVTVAPTGAPCQTLHLTPMPPGNFVRGYKGRLYVAAGSVLYFSEALRPHLTAPRHNFIQFVGDIRFIEALDTGLYIADDRGVWWLSGDDPAQARLVNVSQTTVVSRSSVRMATSDMPAALRSSENDAALWLSTHGYMVGTNSGNVVPLHPERIRLAEGLVGRTVFMLRDGIKQVITLTASSAAPVYGAALDTAFQ